MNSGSRPLSHTPSSAAHSRINPNHPQASANSDSDAETVILSTEEADKKKTLSTRGRRSSTSARKSNGVAKSSDDNTPPPTANPKPSSASSRKQPEDDRAQSADLYTDALSDASEPKRKAFSVEPRKRKFSNESHKSKHEPPRQRLRLDSNSKTSPNLSKSRQASPTSPSIAGRTSHRRSSSMQSMTAKSLMRRKRDASANSRLSDDKGKWADDSSEDSSNNMGRIPNLAPPKSSRGVTRPLASPARSTLPLGRRVDRYGATPLARAAEKGLFEEVVRAYQQAPEEINTEDNGGFTPLQKAALSGNYEIVKFLLDKGCRKDCHSKDDKDTPLIDAVENGHLDVVKLLIEAGVNPHHSNKKGVRAIDAIDDDDPDGVEMKIILQKAMAEYEPEDAEVDDNTHDSPVVRKRQPGAASNRPDLLYQPHNKKTLLKYAREGDLEAVGNFIQSVVPDNEVMCAAARGGHDSVLNIMLPFLPKELKDPDPQKYEETPLLAAIGRNSLKVIRLLTDQDNFNPTRRTKDGKTYMEIAEERKGPRWNQEVELLQMKYDAFKDQKGARKKSMQESRSLNTSKLSSSSKDSTPKSPRTAKPKLSKLEKSDDSHHKRVKDSQPRRKNHLADDASSEASDEEPLSPTRKKLDRSRNNSISSKSGLVAVPSKPKGKPGRKPKEPKRVIDLDHQDSDTESRDMHPVSSKHLSPEPESHQSSSKSAMKQKKMRLSDSNSRKHSRDDNEAVKPITTAPEDDHEDEENDLEKELAARKREAEERRIRESKEAAAKKHQEEKKRTELLNSVPPPIRQALELGPSRLLIETERTDLGREKFGVQYLFTPVPIVPRIHLDAGTPEYSTGTPDFSQENGLTLSWYAIGLLGLNDITLNEFPDWEKIPATGEQLEIFYQHHDQKKIFMTYAWVEMGMEGWDREWAEALEAQAREQFFSMPMFWIRISDLKDAISQREDLKDLEWTTQPRSDLGPKIHPRSIWASFRVPTPPSARNFWNAKNSVQEETPNAVGPSNGTPAVEPSLVNGSGDSSTH